MEDKKDDLELKELGQYYGTESYHNVMNCQVTDGIAYIITNGYSWFVTDMIAVLKFPEDIKGIENADFLAIKLKLDGTKGTATIEDGNGKVLYSQEYEYTDAKRELILYYTNGVLLLSGEY